jgi:hypothetical protein
MINQETIQGELVVLRPATPDDEPQIREWLLHSDVTPSLLGPPLFPERPHPPPEDSGDTIDRHYFEPQHQTQTTTSLIRSFAYGTIEYILGGQGIGGRGQKPAEITPCGGPGHGPLVACPQRVGIAGDQVGVGSAWCAAEMDGCRVVCRSIRSKSTVRTF